MKVLLLGLGLLLLTSCAAGAGNNPDPSEGAPPPQENPYEETEVSARILNFRTTDREGLESETRLLRSYEEFRTYLEDYAIVENPSFIGNEALETLKDIDEAFFQENVVAVAVSVEHSGSNQFEGKRAWVKGAALFLEIERKQPDIGTTDIATRHAVFILQRAQLEDVEQVRLRVQASP